MLLNDRLIQLVQDPAASLWASNCNSQLMPELVRILGCQVEADKEHITFYLPLKFGQELMENFNFTNKLSFLLAIVLTNESYQMKGSYCWHRPCTAAEVQFQEKYTRTFCEALKVQGYAPDKTFQIYYHQPSVAVRMQVKEIFEQTPKIGTGGKIL